jgi:hypothetical protein
MKARDVMVSPVISVAPATSVKGGGEDLFASGSARFPLSMIRESSSVSSAKAIFCIAPRGHAAAAFVVVAGADRR